VARAIDAVGAALAASGGAPGSIGAAVAAARAPEGAPAVTADLAAQVRTYYGLGFAADRRNVPFLRSALRAERDPALRLAIGECLYLSDPDGDTARRTFLDAVPSDPQVLARLWAATGAGEPGARITPILPSLGDLAADANPDALARLVELSPAGALDGGLARTLSDVLADVASMAPEELVGALRGASPAAQEAAVGALGAGVARSDEREHSFPASLRELAARQDETGAFARELQPRLAAAVSAANAARTAPALVPATGALPARAPGGG
jgi:D-alanyl-D-alanine carboxypeptidase/D-alanyl-D-alanine-endopeptidase (penicillin-binding protein 4)